MRFPGWYCPTGNQRLPARMSNAPSPSIAINSRSGFPKRRAKSDADGAAHGTHHIELIVAIFEFVKFAARFPGGCNEEGIRHGVANDLQSFDSGHSAFSRLAPLRTDPRARGATSGSVNSCIEFFHAAFRKDKGARQAVVSFVAASTSFNARFHSSRDAGKTL